MKKIVAASPSKSPTHLNQKLFSAVRQQRLADVSKFLRLGANLDSKNTRGQTPLHVAVECRNSLMAGYLLKSGANHTLTDGQGKKPFQEVSDRFLHEVRTDYQRLPFPEYVGVQAPDRIKPFLQTLKTDGIVKLAQFLDPETLAGIQSDFNRAVHETREQGPKQYKTYWQELPGHTTNIPFRKYNPDTQTTSILDIFSFDHALDLMKMMGHPKLTQLINHYLGGEGYLRDAISYRYVSGDTGSHTGKWHIDAFGKQVHIMVLLTDVGKDDQPMIYVKGSHKLRYDYEFYEERQPNHQFLYTDPEDCKRRMGVPNLEIFTATGKAGDVFVFDTHAVHRARRSNGKTRDVIIVSYSTEKSLTWNLPLPKEVLENNALGKNVHTFDPMINLNKSKPGGQVLPKTVGWVKSLRPLDLWVGRAKTT